MATFDQLSAEQRAIVELVIRQGKPYEELAGMLGMSEARVRELAREALVDLAPVSAAGVEEDWRGQLADYVLGQQVGPEATATKGHLRRSEPARAWARSLVDSLEQLYPNGSQPAIPEGERGAQRRASRRAASAPAGAAAGAELGPEARAAIRRRRLIAAAGAVAALALVAVLVWPVGVLTGGDDEPEAEQAGGGGGGSGGDQGVSAQTRGQALIARQGGNGRPQIIVTASGLPPTTDRSAYQVWLYNSEQDRKSIGAQVTDAQGMLQAGGPLPSDYRDYRFIDVTEVAVSGRRLRTGDSVLRGQLRLRDRPVSQGSGSNRVTLLADIQLLPLPNRTG